jgi:HAD superfamily hydrolase (TIGR01490 family)
VFCDVDETLIRPKSMLDFLIYYFVTHEHGPELARRCLAEVQALSIGGAPRTTTNRAYYRAYAGQPVARVTSFGTRWYAERSSEPGFFIESTLGALAEHRASGAEVVLVSGSFAALLDPIARHVSATALLCTRMLSTETTYTGEVEQPMIGEQKAAAVGAFLADRPEIDPQRCFAYADDDSDIPMLAVVGHPRAVGENGPLLAYLTARQSGDYGAEGQRGERWRDRLEICGESLVQGANAHSSNAGGGPSGDEVGEPRFGSSLGPPPA